LVTVKPRPQKEGVGVGRFWGLCRVSTVSEASGRRRSRGAIIRAYRGVEGTPEAVAAMMIWGYCQLKYLQPELTKEGC
jgi:hypothetical protein